MARYDLIVIGAGWAGYNAALHARKLGKSVCLIEKDQLGGTCLNRGCIPTKVLTHFPDKTPCGKPSIADFQKERIQIIEKLKKGMEFGLSAQKIDFVKGSARIVSKNSVEVEGERVFEAAYILLASGSMPRDLPFLPFDHARVLSSDDILSLESLPENILIIGGGVIGCEFASALVRLGVKVSLVEIFDRLIYMFDRDVSKKLEIALKKSGIAVTTGFDAKNHDLGEYERILISVGRVPCARSLVDASVGVEFEKSGAIKVDQFLATSVETIYAAGDCINSPQLAHVAGYEGRLAVENMFGKKTAADYSAVPSSVFTNPELAQVGTNEDQAKQQGKNIKVIKKPFSSVGMAHILNQTDGFLKLIIDRENDALIGASIIGPYATELINTFTIAVQQKLSLKDLKNLIFAHPSISEAFTEAVQS